MTHRKCLIPHIDAVDTALEDAKREQDPNSIASLLTTYQTSLRVLHTNYDPGVVRDLSEHFTSRLRRFISDILSQRGYSVIRGDLFNTRDTAQFIDTPGATTVFVQAVADEAVNRVVGDNTEREIPERVVDYLLQIALTVDNEACSKAAAQIGLAADCRETSVLSKLVNYTELYDSDKQAARVVRAAFHSTPSFPDHTSAAIPRPVLKEGYRMYRTDILGQTSPIQNYSDHTIDIPTETPIDSGTIFQTTVPTNSNSPFTP